MKKGILAGIVVALACALYVNMENRVAAAVLFSFALFYVCLLNLDLYTGRIGWALEGKKPWTWYLQVLLLNLAGVLVIALPVRFAIPSAAAGAEALMTAKTAVPLWSVLIRGALCGMLMSLAVLCFRKETGFTRYVGVFLCIPLFILAGFEHSIADAAYMVMAWRWDFLLSLVLVVLGNTAGSLFLVWMAKD